MATVDRVYPILIYFRQVRLKRLRMLYDDNEWHILRNKASTGPVWPDVGNGGQLWWRISSLNELVHVKSELRDLGLVYQAMECKALWDKIGRIWSNVTYSGPVFVIVSRYVRLGSYMSLHYLFGQFWHFLWGLIISRSKCQVSAKVARNGPKSYNMNRYSEIWRNMATFDTGYSILINFRQVRLKRLRMPYDENEWHVLRNKASTGTVWPAVGNGC